MQPQQGTGRLTEATAQGPQPTHPSIAAAARAPAAARAAIEGASRWAPSGTSPAAKPLPSSTLTAAKAQSAAEGLVVSKGAASTIDEGEVRSAIQSAIDNRGANSLIHVCRILISEESFEFGVCVLSILPQRKIHIDVRFCDILLRRFRIGDDLEGVKKVLLHIQQNSLRPDKQMYIAILNILNDLTSAELGLEYGLQFLDIMASSGFPLDTAIFNPLIKFCSENLNLAEKLYKKMEELGVEKTVFTYTSLIRVCAKAGNFKKAESYFAEAKAYCKSHKEASLDTHIYTAMISACPKTPAGAQRSKDLHSEMQRSGVAVNAVTLLTLTAGASRRGDSEKAGQYAQAAQDLKPTRSTYITRIKTCSHDPRLNDKQRIEAIKTIVAEMRRESIEIGDEIYLTLIIIYAEIGNTEEAYRLYTENSLHHCLTHRTNIFNELIRTCVRKGNFRQAEKIFYEGISKGIIPDSGTYTYLLDTFANCIKNKDEDYDPIDVIKRILGGIGDNVKRQASVYNVCIKIFVKYATYNETEKELPHILAEMKKFGIDWDRYTYGPLIWYHNRRGDEVAALDLLEKMRVTEEADANIYASFFAPCVLQKDISKAKDILKMMSERGVKPSTETFNGMIQVCLEADDIDEALKFFKKLAKSKEGAPDAVTHNLFLEYYRRQAMYDKVKEWFVTHNLNHHIKEGVLDCHDWSEGGAIGQLLVYIDRNPTLKSIAVITGQGKHSKKSREKFLMKNTLIAFVNEGNYLQGWTASDLEEGRILLSRKVSAATPSRPRAAAAAAAPSHAHTAAARAQNPPTNPFSLLELDAGPASAPAQQLDTPEPKPIASEPSKQIRAAKKAATQRPTVRVEEEKAAPANRSWKQICLLGMLSVAVAAGGVFLAYNPEN